MLVCYLIFGYTHNKTAANAVDSRDGPVVIVGPSLSGKTTLFLALLNRRYRQPNAADDAKKAKEPIPRTVMSATVNEATIRFEASHDVLFKGCLFLKEMAYKVCDYAGHHKLRQRALEAVCGDQRARSIVFVFDATKPFSEFIEYYYTSMYCIKLLGRGLGRGAKGHSDAAARQQGCY